jgi:hypothetical protein
LKDSETKNEKSIKDSIIVKNNEPFVSDERREDEQIPKTSSFSWEPQVKKYANCRTSFMDFPESVASTITEASLLECDFQMVGSAEATTKPMRNHFTNKDIMDELISTSLADLFSSEAVASTTTSHWLQAHKASLLECGFQMVGSAKATKKPMINDFSNEDIIDELISTFQGYASPRITSQGGNKVFVAPIVLPR